MAEPNIFEQAQQSVAGSFPTTTGPEQNIFGNLEATGFEPLADDRRSYFRAAFESGLQQTGATITSIGASLGFSPSRRQLLDIYKDDPEKYKMALSRWGQSADEQQAAADARREPSRLTPEGQRAAAQRYLPGSGEEFVGLERVAGDIAASVPFTVPPMAAAAGGLMVGGLPGAAVAGGVTGAALEGFNQLLEVRGELSKYPLPAWENVPRFQTLVRQGYRPETARMAVIEEVATDAALITGATVGVFDALGGAVIGKMLAAPAASRVGRVVRTGLTEGLTEAPQSAEQALGQNIAKQRTVKPKQNIFEGVGEAAVAGAVTGAGIGGGFGALSPGPRREAVPTTEPTEPGQVGRREWNVGNLITRDGQGFQTAPSPEAGVAMAIRNVQAYPGRFNQGQPMTLRQVAYRWAPPDDGKTPMLKGNNPDNWAKVVADSMGISPDEALDMADPVVMAKFAQGVHRIEHGVGKLFPADVYEKGADLAFGAQPIASGVSTGGSVPADPILETARRDAGMKLTDEQLEEDSKVAIDEALADQGAQEVRETPLAGDVPEMIAAVTPVVELTSADPATPGAVPWGKVAKPLDPAIGEQRTKEAASQSLEQAEMLNAVWQKVTKGKDALGNTPIEQVLARLVGKGVKPSDSPTPLKRTDLDRLFAESEAVLQFSQNETERNTALEEVANAFAEDLLRQAPAQGRAAFGRSEEALETIRDTPNPNNSLAFANLPVSHSARPAQIGKPLRQTALFPGEVIGVGVPTQHYPLAFFADVVQTIRDLLMPFTPRARIIVTPSTRGAAAYQSFMTRLGDAKLGFYQLNPRNMTRIDEVPPGQYNATTRAQHLYGIAHEGGHIIMEEAFLEGLPEDVAEQLRGIGHTDPFEQVPASLITQLEPDRAAILKEYNALKQQMLGPGSKATFGDWLTRVASPQVLVQGVGQPLRQMTLKHWANMYFGPSTWDLPARNGVQIWHLKGWPAGSLHEYMADQFARYAHNKGLLRNTALGKSVWFKDLWAKLKAYWNSLRAAGLLDSRLASEKAFERWIKALAAKPTNPRRGRAVRVPLTRGAIRTEASRSNVSQDLDVVEPELTDAANTAVIQAIRDFAVKDTFGQLHDVLRTIAGKTEDRGTKALAEHLVQWTPDMPIMEMATAERLKPADAPRHTTVGLYTRVELQKPATRTTEFFDEYIAVRDTTPTPVITVLHEAVHAATTLAWHNALARNDPVAVGLSNLHAYFSKLDKTKNHPNFAIRYAATNVEEMLTGAFTDPAVREYMQSIPASRFAVTKIKGSMLSLWDEFVVWVKDVLHIPIVADSVLEQVLAGGTHLAISQLGRKTESLPHHLLEANPWLYQHNILPEAYSQEATETAITLRTLALPAEVEGEALEMLSRGQVEAAKELAEEGLASPNIIHWSAPPPTGLQQHVRAIAQALPTPWQSMRMWYASGMRKLWETTLNFVNVREYAFSDPSNRGAQWTVHMLTQYKRYMNELEGRAVENVTQPLVKMGAKKQRRIFDLLRKEWDEGVHWTALTLVSGTWQHTPTSRLLREAQAVGLDARGVEMFVAVKNEYLHRLREMYLITRSMLEAKMNAAIGAGRGAIATYYLRQIRNLHNGLREVRNTPFLPMTRFGQYLLIVRDRQGNTEHVEAYESPELRARARRRLEASSQAHNLEIIEKTDDTTSSVLSVLPIEVLGNTSAIWGLTPRQMANLRARVGPVTANPLTRKYSLELGRITGHARDQLRAFADFMHHDALVLAKLRYRDQFRMGLDDVAREIAQANIVGNSPRVAQLEVSYSYLSKAIKQILNPAEEYHFIRSLVVLKQLGFSVRTALVNFSTLANTWAAATTTLGTVRGSVVMGKVISDQVINFMAKASQKVMGRVTQGANTITPQERLWLEKAKADGLITETYAADMAFLSGGSGAFLDRFNLPRTVAAQEQMSKWFRSTMRGSLFFLRFVEETARQTTFLTMMRVYRSQGMADNEAYLAAFNDTYMTQGDNTIQVRAPFLRGKVASLFLIYFNFMRNMTYQLTGGYARGRRRLERAGSIPPSKGIINETMRMWLAYLWLGGIMGMLGAEDLDKIAEMLAEKLFGKRFSLKEHAYEFAGFLAQNASDIGIDVTPRSIVHGSMGDVFGFDLSPSMSFGRLIPGAATVDRLGTDGEKFLLELMGPFGKEVQGALNLFNPALPPERQFAFFIPTAAQNIIKGINPEPRFHDGSRIAIEPSTGEVRELSTGELVGQWMGFTPKVVAINREIYAMQADTRAFWMTRRNLLMAGLWEAKLSGEQDAFHDTMAEVRRFNDEAPRGLTITGDGIRQSLLARQKRVLLRETGMAPERRFEPEFGRVRRLVVEGQ